MMRAGYANPPKGGYRSAQMAMRDTSSHHLSQGRLTRGFIGALGLLALMAAPASAQRPADATTTPARVPPITQPPSATIMAEPIALFLAATDTDGDARVSRSEGQAGLARSFATVETTTPGSIGYIGLSEWAERWLGDRNALPSAYQTDSDGDSRITLAELTAQIDRTFTRLDRDRDGFLIRSELLTLDSARGGLNDPALRGRRGRPR